MKAFMEVEWRFDVGNKLFMGFVTKSHRSINSNPTQVYVDMRKFMGPYHISSLGYVFERPPKFKGDLEVGYAQIMFDQAGRIIATGFDRNYTDRDLTKFPWTKEMLQDLIGYLVNLGLTHGTLAELLAPCLHSLLDEMDKLPSEEDANV